MNKTELNNRLAELYGLQPFTYFNFMQPFPPSPPLKPLQVLLIDDWNRLMDLAVNHGVYFDFEYDKNLNAIGVYGMYIEFISDDLPYELFNDHESPQAATRYAIAMALVKLAEGK